MLEGDVLNFWQSYNYFINYRKMQYAGGGRNDRYRAIKNLILSQKTLF